MGKKTEKENEKEKRTLGEYAKGELYPDATRVKNEDIDGETITIKEVTPMTSGDKDYYVILADLKGKDISFGSATAQSNIIKQFLKDKNEFPATVKILIPEGKNYYIFEDV